MRSSDGSSDVCSSDLPGNAWSVNTSSSPQPRSADRRTITVRKGANTRTAQLGNSGGAVTGHGHNIFQTCKYRLLYGVAVLLMTVASVPAFAEGDRKSTRLNSRH